VDEQPFTVFVLGAGRVSVPIGMSWTFLSRALFSSQSEVTTAASMIEDLMDILVQRRVIPVRYHDVYTLSYGRLGPLQGSLVMGSLGVGSLSHFNLRTRVPGGIGELSLSLCYEFR